MSEPRAYTAEEVRDMLLEQFVHVARYWAGQTEQTVEQRCEGVVFSILTTLDGCSMNLPAFDLALQPAPEDEDYCKEQGENWFEPGMKLDFALHEHLHDVIRKLSPPGA